MEQEKTPDNKENLLLELRRRIPSLNPAVKKIADYVMQNPEKVRYLKISELAKKCDVSQGTITKFVKIFGLKNYQQLKIILTEITTQGKVRGEEEYVYEDITKNDSTNKIVDKVVYVNIRALQDTYSLLDVTTVSKAVGAISQAELIDIYGCGGSFIAAENARLRFYRIGKICRAYNDSNQQLVSASLLTKKDVAIGISNSGSTRSIIDALSKAKESGATTICITNYDHSPIVKVSDISLFTSTHASAFFQESTPSRLAQLLIIDILYAGVAIKGFGKSIDYLEKSGNVLKETHI